MKHKPEPKPLFLERMQKLLPDSSDFEAYMKIINEECVSAIRCNTLKISVEDLKQRLEDKGWSLKQPFPNNPEVIVVTNDLGPGELGRALEHMLGYYYIQELVSMLPPIVLDPKPNDLVLDLCASPGSKTTQIGAAMENTGTLIANEMSLGRLKILAANTERCGLTNTIITKKEGTAFCYQMANEGVLFDKILIDAPCSGEGTLRSAPRSARMWNINTVRKMSKIQKHLLASAIEITKVGGEIVYSTCTHSPEENEEILDYILKEFKGQVELEKISLPIKCRPGLLEWEGKEYNKEVQKACRIYPQDANTEGFFISKLRRIK